MAIFAYAWTLTRTYCIFTADIADGWK